jgi:hypothetical protein
MNGSDDARDRSSGSDPGEAATLDDRLVGYRVDADGAPVGHVDRVALTGGTDRAAIVVDLDLVDLGSKRSLPAGAVVQVDDERRVVAVSPTLDQLRSAPDVEPDGADDWLDRLVRHYFGG